MGTQELMTIGPVLALLRHMSGEEPTSFLTLSASVNIYLQLALMLVEADAANASVSYLLLLHLLVLLQALFGLLAAMLAAQASLVAMFNVFIMF